MRSPRCVAAMLLAAAMLQGPAAHSGTWPSEFYSSIPIPMVACPAGDVEFKILMHDFMNRPLAFNNLACSFQECPTVRFGLAYEGYGLFPEGTEPWVVQDTTDAAARIALGLRAGGSCSGRVWMHMNGAILAPRRFVSPDQDGNLAVGAEDIAIAEAKLGTADATADFDGDGTVTSSDLEFVRGHLGHLAPGMATPANKHSWGTIKLLYR